jgi:hypothetical protein
MFQIVAIDDGNTPPYSLFLPKLSTEYHHAVSSWTTTSDVALFAIDYLNGRGTPIDVGANIGVISTPAAMCGSHVVSIEMVPEYCACLTAAIVENRLTKVMLFQTAASDERGTTRFLHEGGNGFIVPPEYGPGPSAVKMTLDDIADEVRSSQGGPREPLDDGIVSLPRRALGVCDNARVFDALASASSHGAGVIGARGLRRHAGLPGDQHRRAGRRHRRGDRRDRRRTDRAGRRDRRRHRHHRRRRDTTAGRLSRPVADLLLTVQPGAGCRR